MNNARGAGPLGPAPLARTPYPLRDEACGRNSRSAYGGDHGPPASREIRARGKLSLTGSWRRSPATSPYTFPLALRAPVGGVAISSLRPRDGHGGRSRLAMTHGSGSPHDHCDSPGERQRFSRRWGPLAPISLSSLPLSATEPGLEARSPRRGGKGVRWVPADLETALPIRARLTGVM